MKRIFLTLIVLFCSLCVFAQSKIFKEVSEDISSSIHDLRENGELVGYIVFTRLEAVSEDSFNYKITIMDENLNDLGVVTFRERQLLIQAMAIEGDVVSIAFVRSFMHNQFYKNDKEFEKALKKETNSLLVQFIRVDGKLLQSYNTGIAISTNRGFMTAYITLDFPIHLEGITGSGFALFHGEAGVGYLTTFTSQGQLVLNRSIDGRPQILTAKGQMYLLKKKYESKSWEGGYELMACDFKDSTVIHPSYKLKDKDGSFLKVIGWGADRQSGNLYLTGNIIHKERGDSYYGAYDLCKGPYTGVFTIDVNGVNPADYKAVYSYWVKDSKGLIRDDGYFTKEKLYWRLLQSFRDFEGNTYFIGTGVDKRTKVAYTYEDAILVKQTQGGELIVKNLIPSHHSPGFNGYLSFSKFEARYYYPILNSNTKKEFLVIDDTQIVTFYDVDQQKVIKAVPRWRGKQDTYVSVAKEGYIMVTEYNKKEKFTKISLQSF